MYPGIWRRRDSSSFGYNGHNHVEMRRTVDPVARPVTLAQLKANARIPYADSDEILSMYLDAAVETVEKYLRRALITQTWDFVCDWGPAWIELPYPNLQQVNGVYTTGLDNVEVQVPSSVYIVNTTHNLVSLNIGNVWPLHRGKAGFRVNYTSGYGPTATSVPASIRRVVLAIATSMDNVRDDEALTDSQADALIRYRVMGEPFRMARGMNREDLLA